MTALQKDPHSRFGTVNAFANAFEQASQPNKSSQSQTVVPTAEPTVYRSNQLPNIVPPIISQPISTEPIGPAQPSAPVTGNSPVMTPPTPQTVYSPPMSDVSLNNSAPVSTEAASPNTTGVITKKRYKPLIDYLVPAKKQTREARFGLDVLLVIAFSVILWLLGHIFIRIDTYYSNSYPQGVVLTPFTSTSLDLLVIFLMCAILGKWRTTFVTLIYFAVALFELAGNPYDILSLNVLNTIAINTGPFNFFFSSYWSQHFSEWLQFFPYFLIYPFIAFIISFLCEKGLGQRFRSIITWLIIGIIVSFVTMHVSFCEYDPYINNQFICGLIRENNLFFNLTNLSINYPYVIVNTMQAPFAGIIIPLLWKLPRVKRNMAKE